MAGYVITLFYSCFFIWLILKIKFFKIAGISSYLIPSVFVLKILSGITLAYIYQRYYGGGDASAFFRDGNVLSQVFLSHPRHYFQILFGINNSAGYLQPYYNSMSVWNGTYADASDYSASQLIIKLNSVFRLFSFGYFHVHTVFMCFISLVGLTAIYKTFLPFLLNKIKELFIAVFLLPSVLFWGSGVLKEGLLLFAIGMLVYYFHSITYGKISFKAVFWIVFSMLILLYSRYYILIALIPGLIANCWIAKSVRKNSGLKYSIVLFVYFLLGLNLHYVFPQYDAMKIIARKQNDFNKNSYGGIYLLKQPIFIFINDENKNDIIPISGDSLFKIKPGTSYCYWNTEDLEKPFFVENSKDTTAYKLWRRFEPTKSLVHVENLKPDVLHLIKNIPSAISRAFFRPHFFEAKSFLTFLAAAENFVIAICFLLSVFFFDRNIQKKELLYFCLTFVLITLTLTGLITPVLGALVRYKTPALPFLLIVFVMLFDKEKLRSGLLFLKKNR